MKIIDILRVGETIDQKGACFYFLKGKKGIFSSHRRALGKERKRKGRGPSKINVFAIT